jgi:hypothetical protein
VARYAGIPVQRSKKAPHGMVAAEYCTNMTISKLIISAGTRLAKG